MPPLLRPSSYSFKRSSGMPQPIKAPTTPAVTPPAPAPATAAANGPAITKPQPGNTKLVPTAAIAAAIAPTVTPRTPPTAAPSAALLPTSVSSVAFFP